MEGEIIFNIERNACKEKDECYGAVAACGNHHGKYINFKKRQGKGNQGIHACKAM